eukprot:4817644-Prorocentrum_lima.AAC.1
MYVVDVMGHNSIGRLWSQRIGRSYQTRTKEGAGDESSTVLVSVLTILDQQSHFCVGKGP